jgi:hypothetical protein
MKRLGFAAILVAAVVTSLIGAPRAHYDYYLTGSGADVSGTTQFGLGLMGGGTDVDALFTWMGDCAGGGDFVVIRASGADGYNQYVSDVRRATCDVPRATCHVPRATCHVRRATCF